jgi:lysophosphatidic acid acyltransferase/lysophosphatidylinositol acyltransferase
MHIYDELKSSFVIIVFLSYIFLVSGLIINLFQLCSCIIWPFNKKLFRKINCYLALGIWSREYYSRTIKIFYLFLNIIYLIELTFLGQWWSKSDCVLYINPEDVHKIVNEHMLIM